MNSGNSYLHYLAGTGKSYLHPGGKALTSHVLHHLQVAPAQHVLEIGCGTGATLADMAQHSNLQLTGVDISASMLQTARERIGFCQLQQKISLLQIEAGGKLPFANDVFDGAFAESVLGIADIQVLPVLLSEIYRVLKPGARLVSNDAIWKKDITAQQIEEINNRCMADFGIVQSIASPAQQAEWEQTFLKAGFDLVSCSVFQTGDSIHLYPYTTNQASEKFSRLKKMQQQLRPGKLLQRLKFEIALKTRHRNDGKHLQTCLFVLQKPKVPAR